MYQSEIAIIQSYIDKDLFEPPSNWFKIDLDYRRYARWIAYELLDTLYSVAELSEEEAYYKIGVRSVLVLIDSMIDQFDRFLLTSNNPAYERIFFKAKDALLDLRFEFTGGEYK
jgi:hypothetical protein